MQWRSAITNPSTGEFSPETTEHNDNWARLVDSNGNTVVPTNAGDLEPRNAADGQPWYKIYMNVSGSWSWQASNVDNDPHPVFWNLNAGSDYKLLVSGRSQGHVIDRILLWDRSGIAYGNLGTGRTNATQNTRSDALLPSELVELSGGNTQFSVQATAIGNLDEGNAPFSVDSIRGALQIDASVVANRDVWARASVSPGVDAGLYDIKITAMQETDGESPYQLLINGIVVGTKVNDKIFGTGTPDYTEQEHVFANVYIPAGATVSVESLAVTNREIPEGDGTAFSRGRWTSLDIQEAGAFAMDANILGEQKQWHKVTLTIDGPSASEGDTEPNPFLDYRMNVTFSNGISQFVVPGYFAADGAAKGTSATSGDKWRAHFTPTTTGEWTYNVSFRAGDDISILTEVSAGSALAPYDGMSGSFQVISSDKSGDDFRASGKGKLIFTGKSYPEWMGGDGAFVKAEVNSPEVFLEYDDFDGLPNLARDYSTHIPDWEPGDPTWKGSRGRGIIGVINYLASVGMNCHYFLTNNVRGDGSRNDGVDMGDNAYPYPWNANLSHDSTGAIDSALFRQFDSSKLDQWQLVFDHMMSKGLKVHFVLTEQENQSLFENSRNGGSGDYLTGFEDTRKLYYREMVARFGYLNAITWNMGEENGWQKADLNGDNGHANTYAQRIAFADYFAGLLAFDDNISIHNGPSNDDSIIRELLDEGIGAYRGISFQGNYANRGHGHSRVRLFRNRADWIVNYDEPYVVTSLDTMGVFNSWRKNSLWAAFTAGAAGVGVYDGGGRDLSNVDYRNNSEYWEITASAAEFFASSFADITLTTPDDSLVSLALDQSGTFVWCLAHPDEAYAIYIFNEDNANTEALPEVSIDLSDASGTFEVWWFDPRNGGALQEGSVTTVTGGEHRLLGDAPNNPHEDWAILVRKPTTDLMPTISSSSLAEAVVGVSYSEMLTVVGGDSPYSWSIISGALPDGLSLDNQFGIISGTPTTEELANFTVQVEDADGDRDTQALSITVNPGESMNLAPVVSFSDSSPTHLPLNYTSIDILADAEDLDGTIEHVTLYLDDVLIRLDANPRYRWQDEELVGLGRGTYELKVIATDDDGTTAEAIETLTVGRIEAEDFDVNNGFLTEETADVGGGENVGWTESGDSLQYQVNFGEGGDYDVTFRVASAANNIHFAFQYDNGGTWTNLSIINEPTTGAWQTWKSVTRSFTMPAGNQTLRILAIGGGWNLNWMEFAIPGVVEALTYEEWAAGFPEIADLATDLNGNFDGGALSNLEEFAFGGDPTDPSDDNALLPDLNLTQGPEAGELFFDYSFRRRVEAELVGLSYTSQYTDDLRTNTWSGDLGNVIDVSEIDDEFELVTVRFPRNTAGNRRFFRLQIEKD